MPQGDADDVEDSSISGSLHALRRQLVAVQQQFETHEHRKARREWVTIAGIFITAAFALGQGIVFCLQLAEMKSAAVQTNKAIEMSNRIASAAVRANELAEEANRPWIGATGRADASPPPTDGKPFEATLYIINAGKSPAYVTAFKASARTFASFPDDPPYALSPGEPATPSHSIVEPGQVIVAPFAVGAMDEPTITAIKAGIVGHYIYGEVTYEDIATKQAHVTHICYIYRPDFGIYANCTKYNDAN